MAKAMLGDSREFELEWVSVYSFQCRRMEKFRHGHDLFPGDAAHQVSPFGARGANSGIQDADNLIWKLKLVLARDHAFARALVNSGRLSVPTCLSESRLNTPNTDSFTGDMVPGAPMHDAPMNVARDGISTVKVLPGLSQPAKSPASA